MTCSLYLAISKEASIYLDNKTTGSRLMFAELPIAHYFPVGTSAGYVYLGGDRNLELFFSYRFRPGLFMV